MICLEEVFFGDVRFFGEKSALTECSPRASCYLEQKVGGSRILCCLKTAVLKKSSLLGCLRLVNNSV